jgi:hypothetical protein
VFLGNYIGIEFIIVLSFKSNLCDFEYKSNVGIGVKIGW